MRLQNSDIICMGNKITGNHVICIVAHKKGQKQNLTSEKESKWESQMPGEKPVAIYKHGIWVGMRQPGPT